VATKILELTDVNVVKAAGGIVCREGSSGETEIVVVHRPAYDDWTLPKGKVDSDETPQECALREVREETVLAAAELDAEIARRFMYPLVATDEQGGSQTLLDEAHRRADHLLLLAFGEDDALRAAAQPLVHPLQKTGDGIAPRAQLRPVCIHICDRPAGNARIHCRLRDRGRHEGDQARIERNRNDILGAIFRPKPVRRRNLVGYILARQHDRFEHRRMLVQRGLDLAQLDAVAAQLDLLVGATEELQRSVGPVARQIPRPIPALPILDFGCPLGVWILDC